MVVAKGRTDCEAERDTIVQGFNDLLTVLKQAKAQIEVQAKASLYDVINDKSLSKEEQYCQMVPFKDLLSEQEEADIRIRRAILIGLFSFWELSVKDICEYYNINVGDNKSIKKTPANKSTKDDQSLKLYDYVKAIFPAELPYKVHLISLYIRELRNYMTHGSATDRRQVVIENLIAEKPDFFIRNTLDEYIITSYDGLKNILNVIIEGLIITENAAKSLTKQKSKSKKS